MVLSGAVLDADMAYFDARLSLRFPTVEVRVADEPLAEADAALIAVLARALVETAAREAADGIPPLATPAFALRLAAWRASRSGLAGDLVHPLHGAPVPAGQAVEALLGHLAPALRGSGELALAEAGLATVLDRGTGERAQRQAAARSGLHSIAEAAAAAAAGPHTGPSAQELP